MKEPFVKRAQDNQITQWMIISVFLRKIFLQYKLKPIEIEKGPYD
jgi:hypothetical protein